MNTTLFSYIVRLYYLHIKKIINNMLFIIAVKEEIRYFLKFQENHNVFHTM